MQTSEDKIGIACNIKTPTKIFRLGTLCYVTYVNYGGGCDRIKVIGRSRGSRIVQTWLDKSCLTNFRLKTIPAEHPNFNKVEDFVLYAHKENLINHLNNHENSEKLP